MSRAPARRPLAPPERADICPRNDDCRRQQAEAQTRIADHLDALFGPPGAGPDEEGWLTKVLKAIGAVFARWERLCVWVRAKTPKHGWWVVLVAWIVSNFVSPELKVAIQNVVATWLNSYAAGGV